MRPFLRTAGALVAGLPPASFALVMSTGIISLACHFLGLHSLALVLFWLNVGFYLILGLLYFCRLVLYYQELLADFRSHSRGPGFLTMVAGTCLLASGLVILLGSYRIALGLLGLGAGLWLWCLYGQLTFLAIKSDKPGLAAGINGLWLMATVSTQSLAILFCLVSPQFPQLREHLLFAAFSLFLLGGALYFLIIPLIVYRLLFLPLKPRDLTPPYWIISGAAAISTLAGTTLMAHGQGPGFLPPLSSFLLGSTLLFWGLATWWLPLLVILGVWRHFMGQVDSSYSHQYWGMVFPLGMYTACTAHLAEFVPLPLVMEIPRYFIYVALAAWALTLAGLVRWLGRALGAGLNST